MSKKISCLTTLLVLACSLTLWPVLASAQDAFYKGKTMRVVVGFAAGGGFDTYARAISRHMGKHIPGKPNFVVQNMPLPTAVAGANYVYNVAKPDGLTIGAASAGLFSRALSQPDLRFELDKFTWLANLYSATVIFWMRTDFPCQSLEALSRCPERLQFGATSRGSTGYGLVPEILKEAFGLNMDIIYGYKTGALLLALEQGEIHASGGDLIGFFAGRPAELMEAGKVRILLQVAGRKSPELEPWKVPWVMDVVPPKYKGLFVMVNPLIDMARPYFAPPGLPPARAEILQEAFRRLAADPAFLTEVKKAARIEVDAVVGAEMAQAIKDMLNQPPEIKSKVVQLLGGN
jgi:tripartite-type tricarboxylate transporter receptor subunit TctC